MATVRGQYGTPRLDAADHVTLRRHNLSVVLHHLRSSGPCSRARIAADTGLNKATVSSLVAELTERGLVELAESERGAVGRPGQLVRLDGRRVCGIGAEVNVDYLAVMAMALDGTVILERRLPLAVDEQGVDAVLATLAGLVESAVDEVTTGGSQVAGLTLAVPGLVDVSPGLVAIAPNLGWVDVPVIERMRALLPSARYPARIDNEANLAALAAFSEVGRTLNDDLNDVLLITGSVGIGGGMVSGGRILRGGHGFAGEVGHMSVGSPDLVCGCGRRGCWESVVGLGRLLELAAAPDDEVRDPALDVVQRLEELARRAEAGDARTLQAIEEVRRWLAVGASVLVNVLNPDVLVLGGYFAQMQPWLTRTLQADLAERVIAPHVGGCQVLVSDLAPPSG